MPRDSNGLYSLPTGNPVTDGSVIEAEWANNTISDLAVQMNNVYTRDGLLGPTEPVLLPNGSPTAPSLAFATQPILGLYRDAQNVLGVTSNGAISFKFSNVDSNAILPLGINDGTVTEPSLKFSASSNTGLFRKSSGEIVVAVAGAESASFFANSMSVAAIETSGAIRTGFVLVANQDDVAWSGVVGQVSGIQRWMLRFADEYQEGAGNLGSDFTILRADNAGNILSPHALVISRATGKTTLQAVDILGALSVAGAVVFSSAANFSAGFFATDTNITNLLIGGPNIASGYLFRSAANTLAIRAGDMNQGTFGYYSFTPTQFACPADIYTATRVVINGTGTNGSVAGSQAIYMSGTYGGGIFMNESPHWCIWYGENGNARIRSYQSSYGDYIFKFNANGDFVAKNCIGYTDNNHYVSAGWDGASAIVNMQNGANIGRIYVDPTGNLILGNGGGIQAFCAIAGGFYMVRPTGSWLVQPMDGGVVASNASSQIAITFVRPFGNPCVVCSCESTTGKKIFVTILTRTASGFTARINDDAGGDVGAGYNINWIAMERNS